jgi:hypothetical protein
MLQIKTHDISNSTGTVDVISKSPNLIFFITYLYSWSSGLNSLNTSVAFSPQANYTDWATGTGRRILVGTLVDRGALRGQSGVTHTAVNFSYLDRSHYLSFQVTPYLSSRGWLDTVPDPLLLRAGNRTRDPWICSQELWPLDCRDGLKFTLRACYNLAQSYFLFRNIKTEIYWSVSARWRTRLCYMVLRLYSIQPEEVF